MPTTYTLKFELAPDPFANAGDSSTCKWFIETGGTYTDSESTVLGTFTSALSTGGGYVWTLETATATGFDPHSSHVFGRYDSGQDFSHIRRVRVEGSDGSIWYGEFPSTYPYVIGDQDGYPFPGAGSIIGASGGAGVAVQWSKRQIGATSPLVVGWMSLDPPTGGSDEGWAIGTQFRYVHFYFH